MSKILVPISDSMIVIGVISAVVAAIYAVFERDNGRALGWSSVSQLGIAILSPTYACLYAMQHGICKALYSQRFNRNRNFLKLITIQKPMDMAQIYKPKILHL